MLIVDFVIGNDRGPVVGDVSSCAPAVSGGVAPLPDFICTPTAQGIVYRATSLIQSVSHSRVP